VNSHYFVVFRVLQFDGRFDSAATMAQGSCSLLGAMDRPSFSTQMQANATPTSADACLSIVHSLMCHRQVC